jgi:excisionase family DNA binding protein
MDQAAAQLKISRRVITRWVSEGRIRAYTRPGDRHRYVDLDEIKRYREEYTPVEPKEKPDQPEA